MLADDEEERRDGTPKGKIPGEDQQAHHQTIQEEYPWNPRFTSGPLELCGHLGYQGGSMVGSRWW